MNGNELADEYEAILKESEERPWGNFEILYDVTIDVLRKLEADKELLFKAHSYEMVRADKLQIEVDRLAADNGHYRDMAVDFLRCREPYGWHCFTEDDDCLIMNGKVLSKPDGSWTLVVPLYLHAPRQEPKK